MALAIPSDARRQVRHFQLPQQVFLDRLARVVRELLLPIVVFAAPGAVGRADALFAPVIVDHLDLCGSWSAAAAWVTSGSGVGGSTASKPLEVSASSTGSSITLLSSSSRIWACSSRAGNWSSRMACCNCGVMVSC